jgi:hypothetical protein
MKVIAYETCKVVMLFPLEEVVPLGGASDPDIVAKIRDRYRFTNSPDLKSEEIAKNGLKFEMGNFQFEKANVRITDFALYRDGIVVNATKTDAAEVFLDDIVSHMQKEFSFRDFITKPRKYFQSQIVVEFDRSPAKLIESLDKILKSLSKRLAETYEIEIPMEFSRLDLDFDRTINIAPALIQRVVIERRNGVPFDKERYFCAAPLRTADHEALLREIEILVR